MSAPLREFPVLPLRDVVVYPHMVIPLFVGREKSINALEMAMEAGKQIFLIAQKSATENEPSLDDIYHTITHEVLHHCIRNLKGMDEEHEESLIFAMNWADLSIS